MQDRAYRDEMCEKTDVPMSEVDSLLQELSEQCDRLDLDIDELYRRLDWVMHPEGPCEVVVAQDESGVSTGMGRRLEMRIDSLNRAHHRITNLLGRLGI